jgi:hypothetical protein
MTVPPAFIEICGLEHSQNGRSCGEHPVCGKQVEVGTKVVFRNVKVSGIRFS